MQWAKTNKSGFTIVELLIVVVVIAILAAITIVAYNGIQQNSRYSVMKSDIATYNKAILMYQAKYGNYPYNNAGPAGNVSGRTLNISGLNEFLSTPPTMPNDGVGGYYAYIWSTNGTEYKIVRLSTSASTLPAVEVNDSNPDTYRPGRGWGVWSSGGAGL